MNKNVDLLQKTVAETAGSTLTLSPTESGWQCYMMQQKKKFENPDIEVLSKEVSDYIVANREPREVNATSKKAGASKPFKMK